MSIRPIKRVVQSQPTLEGAGVKLRRAFGFGNTGDFDPFLLLDDFRNEHPQDYLAGFPWHPHRGIETITYVLAARFNAALEVLKRDPRVDTTRIAAIGYCFGGAVVLGMARAGADLAAVVTFHGALATTSPAQPGKVKARVLVLAGGADPFVPPEQVEAFKKEMQAAGARFEVITYPGAKHGFTNPDAAKYAMPQLAYDAAADRESWAAMLKLFKEIWPS